jgi:hypothetical protein
VKKPLLSDETKGMVTTIARLSRNLFYAAKPKPVGAVDGVLRCPPARDPDKGCGA